MCGRMRITQPAMAVSQRYLAQLTNRQAEMFPPGEYDPGEGLLAVSHDDRGGAEINVITWGLTASWLPPGKLLRHARAESALVKRTFATAARERRCIIPVDAWYERGTRPGVHRGYHAIGAANRAGVALAALWWPGPDAQSPRRLVIVTKEASGAPAQIHHRCPMVSERHEVSTWVNPKCATPKVRQMLGRPSGEEGAFRPIPLAA